MKRTMLSLTILAAAASSGTFSSYSVAQTAHNETAVPGARVPAEERGIVALDQALRELGSPFTVLWVAAHPGDEDAGTLAYCHKKLGARTVAVFATRAE